MQIKICCQCWAQGHSAKGHTHWGHRPPIWVLWTFESILRKTEMRAKDSCLLPEELLVICELGGTGSQEVTRMEQVEDGSVQERCLPACWLCGRRVQYRDNVSHVSSPCLVSTQLSFSLYSLMPLELLLIFQIPRWVPVSESMAVLLREHLGFQHHSKGWNRSCRGWQPYLLRREKNYSFSLYFYYI